MSDYNSIDESLQAGTVNMSVLRDNVRSTDGLRTISLGEVDWFIFNENTITSIFISADSWIGFGSPTTKNFQINDQTSCEVWDEFIESGYIRGHEYIKYRFSGESNSAYDPQSGEYYRHQDYVLIWDIYLFDTGQIYFHGDTWPRQYFGGTYKFTCGSQILGVGNSDNFYYTPKNLEEGTNWILSNGKPHLPYYYEHGYYVYPIPNASSLNNVCNSKISWIEKCPRGSSLNIQILVNGELHDCTNGEPLPDSAVGHPISSMSLVVMLNANDRRSFSPTLFDLCLEIWDSNSSYNIILLFQKGNRTNFANAPSSIIVQYNGAGLLMGYGGAVTAFSEAFYPTDLIAKPNVADIERVAISADSNNALIEIYGSFGYGPEHIDVNANAYVQLIHIDDL